MATKYTNHVNPRKAAKEPKQSKKLKGQIRNSDGAAVWGVTPMQRLDRFLILGSEGGSYYASERMLTRQNAKSIAGLIENSGVDVVNRVVEISDSGRAPKNDPALFVLAMCAGLGNDETRKHALNSLPKVARIGTHLFHFVEYVEAFRGWGRALRNAVADWYLDKPLDKLSFQLAKYQSRDGWSHRDVLRLAHAIPTDDNYKRVLQWAVDRENVEVDSLKDIAPAIWAYEQVKKASKDKDVVKLVKDYNLPMELVPTDKRTRKVYEVMIENFGITALIRNLGNLSKVGILTDGNFTEVQRVCERLTDVESLKKGRVHPFNILVALKTYQRGSGSRGSGSWPVASKVVDALDDAFYKAFDAVEPTGKRYLLGLDVSSSMDWSGGLIGCSEITPRIGAACMAMVTSAVEDNVVPMAFSDSFMPFPLSLRQRLDSVCERMRGMRFSSTDCSLPMQYAIRNDLKIDVFVVYTDSETNHYGSIQPAAALRKYREKSRIDAKLIVVGMTSNGFTIADPEDAGMLDVVGFDSATPQIISEFAAGNI